MTNKKYQQGRRFEYRVRDYLIQKGYFVVRSAGSKGSADLIAIIPHYSHSKVFLIQCKYGKSPINRQEIVKLTRIADRNNAIPVLASITETHQLRFINLMNTLEIEM